MLPLPARIALRYLFSKKSHHAINIVSGVSSVGVMVVTAALVCVLSVMNGFSSLIEQMFSQLDAPLKITKSEGKSFRMDDHALQAALSLDDVAVYSVSVEEMAMIEYQHQQVPARVKGVDANFDRLTEVDSIIHDGKYMVYDGAFERCVLGRGLAAQVGINPHFVGALHVYAPKRKGQFNRLRPEKSLNQLSSFIAGTFAVNQAKYDDALMLVSLPFARALFDYDEGEVTSVELALKEGASVRKTKQQIRSLLGPEYLVQDRYEQQADMFRIMKIEKLMTMLLLCFILLIASFNVIGSLSMLIIDKQADTLTLRNLGADQQLVQRTFLLEGWLITLIGAAVGLVAGLTICLLQQHFGWLKLGDGTDFVISAYPVVVKPTDILLVIAMVLSIGGLAAWIPTRKFVINPQQYE